MATQLNQTSVKKSAGKSAWFWVAIGLGSFFGLGSMLLIMLVIAFFSFGRVVVSGEDSVKSRKVSETVISGAGHDKIVIVPIKGIIGDKAGKGAFFNMPSAVQIVKDSLEQAASDKSVKAVILEIDSPGGGITASDIIYNNIAGFKKSTQKTVVVFMRDLAASGGYYIAVAADKIIAHPTTITGSIGVIMPLMNVTKLVEKYGIENSSIKSGRMKDIGSPFKKMEPDEERILSGIINEMYMRFVSLIAKGRNMPVEEVKELADGRIFTGNQAVENGLIDQTGYLEDAIEEAKELSGVIDAKIIRYQKKLSFGDLISVMAARLGGSPEITIKLNDLPINQVSKPMYLWTGG